jgi:acyl-CoA dehydrogenase
MGIAGYELPPELDELRQAVRTFMREEILPLERSMDPEATDIDQASWQRLVAKTRAAGLWALWAPARFGGKGLGALAQAVLLEEMAQHRNGLYNPGYGLFGRYPPEVCYECSPDQAERYVTPAIAEGSRTFFAMSEPTPTEPRGGADPAAGLESRAVRDGDRWVINGAKTWISNGSDAEWGVVFVRTGSAEAGEGVSCFFVRHGTFRAAPIPVIRAEFPDDLAFEDCVVSHADLLGEEGCALPMAQRMLVRNRLAFSAAQIGVAVAALRLAAEQCAKSQSSLQWTLADCEIEVRAARWLTWECAWAIDRGEEFRLQASIAKLYSSEALLRVVDRAIQIHGGYGVSKELPLERWYREARGRLVAAGASESLRADIARTVVRAQTS